MEEIIEKYLRDLAVKYNPYFEEDPEEDDSIGIIVFQRRITFDQTETYARDIYKNFEYVLLIGMYEKKPDMESVINELLWLQMGDDPLILDGKEFEVELIEGQGDYSGAEGGKMNEGNYEGINFYRAINVKLKYIYDIKEITNG